MQIGKEGHGFQEKLAESLDAGAIEIFDAFYKELFGKLGLVNVERITNIERQKRGIDVILHFGKDIPLYIQPNRSRSIKIDEKIRQKSWDDILVEIWSDAERKIPGWAAKDLETDYVAYCFKPTRDVKLLYFPALREWVKQNKRKLEQIPLVKARNKAGYVTHSRAVPTKKLKEEVGRLALKIWEDAKGIKETGNGR